MAQIQTAIPASRVPAVEGGDVFTREWFRYFSDLYTYTGIGTGPLVNGQFLNTGTLTAAANTPTTIALPTTSVSQGVAVDTTYTSRLVFAKPSVCLIGVMLQADNSAVAEDDLWAWLRVKGTDVPNSASTLTIHRQHTGIDGSAVLALNFVYTFAAGDYAEIVWMNTTGTARLLTSAASVSPARPAAPAVVVTVNQINMSAP